MSQKPAAVRRAAVPLLAALALSGCGGSPDHPSSKEPKEPPVEEVRTLVGSAGLAYPLDAYEHRSADREVVNRSQSVLVSRCMSRYGFTFTGLAQPPRAGAEGAARYGVSDPARAARHGYARPGGSRGAPPTPVVSGAERLALYGREKEDPGTWPTSQQQAERRAEGPRVNGAVIPAGGCVRESYLKLWAPTPDSVDALFVFHLRAEAEARAFKDSRIREVLARWSSCMKESGYSTTSPLRAAKELGFEGPEASSAAAVTAAKADVNCKKKVNLVGIAHAVDSAYQQQLVEQHTEKLQLAKAQADQRFLLASSLIKN
ncbi:hypothetical protein [Streptomyces sp. NPDC058953]|uniref:hypothetical protein n=1 Tax=unclassified Streptomyces TaxID=2593676 RepID=UPI003691A1C0